MTGQNAIDIQPVIVLLTTILGLARYHTHEMKATSQSTTALEHLMEAPPAFDMPATPTQIVECRPHHV